MGDDIISRMKAEQEAFEKWANSHGGLSLTQVGLGGSSRKGRFPSTYWEDETEIAWRAWTNKPAAQLAAPVADLVTRESALQAIEHVEQSNSTGRADDARKMLAAPQGASHDAR